MSSFLLDKKFSELYERHFANELNMEWNETNKDDHGIDIFDMNKKIYIDIKCYAAPLYVKHFEGAFIETFLPKSGRDGWLYDEDKKTTHYILLQDCDRDKVNYFKGWYLSRDDLKKAMKEAAEDMALTEKAIASAVGYILPYRYLDKYCIETWYGNRRTNKNIA